MLQRPLLYLATLVLGYQAWVIFMLETLNPLTLPSTVRGFLWAFIFIGMITGLWLRPKWGRWPAIAFLGIMLCGAIVGIGQYHETPSQIIFSLLKAGVCGRIICALVRAHFLATENRTTPSFAV